MSASLEAGIEKQMTKIEKGFTFLATVHWHLKASQTAQK